MEYNKFNDKYMLSCGCFVCVDCFIEYLSESDEGEDLVYYT